MLLRAIFLGHQKRQKSVSKVNLPHWSSSSPSRQSSFLSHLWAAGMHVPSLQVNSESGSHSEKAKINFEWSSLKCERTKQNDVFDSNEESSSFEWKLITLNIPQKVYLSIVARLPIIRTFIWSRFCNGRWNLIYQNFSFSKVLWPNDLFDCIFFQLTP